MRAAGVAESDFPYAEFIINHENGMWCPTRWQGQNFCPPYYAEKFPGAETHTSTGYGLCQSTPAITTFVLQSSPAEAIFIAGVD